MRAAQNDPMVNIVAVNDPVRTDSFIVAALAI